MTLSPTVTTGRSVVLTRNGMVCSASPLAAAAGLQVL
jgi:gamma-glutamyltranspeptidase